LAHCTLPSSVDWHPDIGVPRTSRADVAAFYARYLDRIGTQRAEALRPWLMPMRRLTWLRTTMFFCRWRVETRGPRDPANPAQWSDAGLDPRMKAHIDARIDDCFARGTIWRIRAEWMGPDPLAF
ncbi:MAG: hypothetical protein JNL07_00945, partial [Rhodospirillales bacterium]|nr:hypothetical protein [Rhodospirillales bacterium]